MQEVANTFGVVGTLDLCLLLVPASRHSALLAPLGLPYEAALSAHRTLGQLGVAALFVHGCGHYLRGLKQRNLHISWPPPSCWRSDLVRALAFTREQGCVAQVTIR